MLSVAEPESQFCPTSYKTAKVRLDAEQNLNLL